MTEIKILRIVIAILVFASIMGIPYFFDGNQKYYAYAVVFLILSILAVRLLVLRKRQHKE